jgi:hypothetical protein
MTGCLQLEIRVEIGKYVKGGRLGILMNEYFILSKSTSLLDKAWSEVKNFTYFISLHMLRNGIEDGQGTSQST